MPLIPFVKQPWAHQIKAVERALECRDFAFFMEQGVGKSKATVDTLRNIYARKARAAPL